MNNNITALVLAKDEQDKIGACLNSLNFCDEILVIDDNSKDETSKISKQNGAIVLTHDLNGDFSAQRNYGLENVKTVWTLFVDADETVSNELKLEILDKIQNTNENGFYLKRQDYFISKYLKYGDPGSFRSVRLAKTNNGKWKGKVHEVWEIPNVFQTLVNPLNHHPHTSLSSMIDTLNVYSTIRANELHKSKIKSGVIEIVSYPIAKFVQNYFIRKGFLDGSHGMANAILMSFYSFLVRSKLLLLNRK